MPRNAFATLSSYTETASWATGAASKSTPAAVSWNTGDFIVVAAGQSNNATLGVPTATGLTFTSRVLTQTASVCAARISTATAASASSATISVSNSSSTNHWGFAVWVFSGSDGLGNTAEQHTSTKTVSLTATDAFSAFAYTTFDFLPGAAGSALPVASHARQAFEDGTQYSVYVSDADPGPSGTISFGVTGTASTGPFSIQALEILGTTSGGSTPAKELAALGVG